MQTDLAQVNPVLRKEFLRDGALNAMWKAWSTHLGIAGLEEAEHDDAGLPLDKLTMRRQFLALSKKFLEAQRTREMDTALECLKEWRGFLDAEMTATAAE